MKAGRSRVSGNMKLTSFGWMSKRSLRPLDALVSTFFPAFPNAPPRSTQLRLQLGGVLGRRGTLDEVAQEELIEVRVVVRLRVLLLEPPRALAAFCRWLVVPPAPRSVSVQLCHGARAFILGRREQCGAENAVG